MNLDNKSLNKKKLKTLNFICIFMVFVMAITSLIVFSGAWAKKSSLISGEVSFSQGIKADVKNLSITNEEFGDYANLNILVSQYFDGTNLNDYSTAKVLNPTNFNAVSANQYFTILNPSITPKEDSLSYYLRSKWIITVNGEELEESEWLEKANIKSMPIFNSENWQKGSDKYYYNTNSNTLNGKDSLNVNSTQEVVFFDNNEENLQIKIASSDQYNNTVVKNMNSFSIELRIEVVETTGDYLTKNDWQPTTGLVEVNNIQNYNYYIDNEDNLTLINYLGELTEVKVPNSFDLSANEYNAGRIAYLKYINEDATEYTYATSGKTVKVKAIGKETDNFYTESFSKNAQIIEFSEGIELINNYALNGSTSLTKLSIPSTLKKIGVSVFENCSVLSEVVINNNTKYTYENGLLIADNTDLIFCSNVSCQSQITLNTSITKICESAFYGVSNLKSINLTNVEYIGEKAFYGCSSIEYFVIPTTTKYIKEKTFENCELLSYIDVKAENLEEDYTLPKIENKSWYKNGAVLLDNVISKDNSIGVYSLKKAEEESLGSSEEWQYIIEDEKVYLVKYIGSISEEQNSLTIPSYITSSTGVVLKVYGVKSLDGNSIITSDTIENLNISLGVVEVGENAFTSLSSIKNINFSKTIETIGNSAFKNCTNIGTVNLLHLTNLNTIEQSAFENCQNIKLLYLSDALINIGPSAFKDCLNVSNTINLSASNIKVINESAFENCQSITEILLPTSVTGIGTDILKDCTGLRKLTVPFIGSSRDDNETNTSVLGYFFGQSTTGTTQQYSATGTATYGIPSSLKTVTITDANFIPYGAFYGCSNITSIILTNTTGTSNSLTTINDKVLYGCTSLATFTLPSTLTTIGNSVFENCTSLTEITIPTSVKTVGESVFAGCTSLVTVNNLENTAITTLPDNFFKGCTKLTTFTLPSTLTTIGNNAFENCTSLTEITIPTSVKTVGESVFAGCTSLVTVNNLKKLSIITLPKYFFKGCTSLPTVSLPNVSTLEEGIFLNCIALQKIVIPDSVNSIGINLLKGCKFLDSLTVPFIGENINDNRTKTSVFGYFFGEAESETDEYLEIVTKEQEYAENLSAYYFVPRRIDKLIITKDNTIPYGAFSGLYNFTSFGSAILNNENGEFTLYSSYILLDESILNITIDKSVFKNSLISSIYITKEVSNIEEEAFEGCTGLKSIRVDTENQYYANNANDKKTVTNEDGSEKTTQIYVLYTKDLKTLIKFPNNYNISVFESTDTTLEIIGNYAFYQCVITTVKLPNSITSIGENAFKSMSNLLLIKLNYDDSEDVPLVKGNCNLNEYEHVYYYSTELENGNKFITEKGIYTTEEFGFVEDWEYTSIDLGVSIYNYIELTKYVGPNNNISILKLLTDYELNNVYTVYSLHPNEGTSLFTTEQNITIIRILDGLSHIYANSFSNTQITEISIPSTVSYIDNHAFDNVSTLQQITVATENVYYCSIDGLLYINNSYSETEKEHQLLKVPEGYQNEILVIDSNAITVETNAINNVTKLKGIRLTNVTTLKENSIINLDNILWLYFEKDLYNKYNLISVKNTTWYKDSKQLFLDSETSINIICNDFYSTEQLSPTIYWEYISDENGNNYLTKYKANKTILIENLYIPSKLINIQNNEIINIKGINSNLDLNSITTINNIYINEGIEEIKLAAFASNTYVTEITLPSTLTTIGNNAFENCTSLTEITIPTSVISIGTDILKGCTKLSKLTIPFIGSSRDDNETNTSVLGYFFGQSTTGTTQQYSATGTATYGIPSSLKTVTITDANFIPYGAFSNCSNITSIILTNTTGTSNSLTTINNNVLYGCTGLEKFTFADTITTVQEGMFAGCTSLVTVNNLENTDITTLPNNFFKGCTSLTEITIPTSVETVGESVFAGCTSLINITIPKSVTSIGTDILKGCTSLQTLTIPFIGDVQGKNRNVKSVLGYFFGTSETGVSQMYTTNKTQTYGIPSSLKYVYVTNTQIIPYGAFSNCAVTNVSIIFKSGSDAIIYDYAFSGSSISCYLSNCKKINSYAFKDCKKLKTVVLPDTVTTIGLYILAGCFNLQSLTTPFIGQVNTEINTNFALLGYFFGTTFFYNSYATSQKYNTDDNIKYYIPNSLTYVYITKGNYDASTGTYFIPYGAFYNCSNIKEIKLGSTISEINNYAFEGCSNLTDIYCSDNSYFTFNNWMLVKNGTTLYKISECYNKYDEGYDIGKSLNLPDFSVYGNKLEIPTGITKIKTGAITNLNKVTLRYLITNNVSYLEENAISITIVESLKYLNLGKSFNRAITSESLIFYQAYDDDIVRVIQNKGIYIHIDSYDRYYKNYYWLSNNNNYDYEDDNGSYLVTRCYKISDLRIGEIEFAWHMMPKYLFIINKNSFIEIKGISYNTGFKNYSYYEYLGVLFALQIKVDIKNSESAFFSKYIKDYKVYLELPEGYTTIKGLALLGSVGIRSIKIPSSMTYIESNEYGSALMTNPSSSLEYGLQYIDVSSDNKYFKSIEGVLYSKNGKTLIKYPDAKEGKTSKDTSLYKGCSYYNVDSNTIIIYPGAFSGTAIHMIKGSSLRYVGIIDTSGIDDSYLSYYTEHLNDTGAHTGAAFMYSNVSIVHSDSNYFKQVNCDMSDLLLLYVQQSNGFSVRFKGVVEDDSNVNIYRYSVDGETFWEKVGGVIKFILSALFNVDFDKLDTSKIKSGAKESWSTDGIYWYYDREIKTDYILFEG